MGVAARFSGRLVPGHRRLPISRPRRPGRGVAGARDRSWRASAEDWWNSDATPPGDHESSIPIPVVGGQCLRGPEDREVPDAFCRALGRLAEAVGAALLTVLLVESDGQFLFSTAVPTVDVS